jgi:L-lysine 2,3-aminomutase
VPDRTAGGEHFRTKSLSALKIMMMLRERINGLAIPFFVTGGGDDGEGNGRRMVSERPHGRGDDAPGADRAHATEGDRSVIANLHHEPIPSAEISRYEEPRPST